MSPEMKGFLLLSVLKLLLVFTVVMVGVALLTLMERKVSAWMQNRLGPNRVGYGGLLQPAADGLKNILKEETFPAEANPVLFTVAPALAFIPALMLSAVIPFAAPLPINSDDFGRDIGHWFAWVPGIGGWLDEHVAAAFHFVFGPMAHHGPMPMVVADVPVGFLFILAIASLGVYGIALAGWSSNSKYSLLGGLRASAQLVSYEVALGLSLIPVLLLTGDVSFTKIIADQQQGLWFVLPLFLSFFIFLVSGFAETNRLPFDLPEAESELIAGYHTEYSAMKFSLFFIAEYASMVTASALMATLFFGGWDVPFTARDNIGPYSGWLSLLSIFIFLAKILFFLFLYMWVRWTLPRFRYDQLMSLGWKFMLPLALIYIVLIAAVLLGLSAAGIGQGMMQAAILGSFNIAFIIVLFAILDRGRIISPAYGRMSGKELQRLRGIDRRREML